MQVWCSQYHLVAFTMPDVSGIHFEKQPGSPSLALKTWNLSLQRKVSTDAASRHLLPLYFTKRSTWHNNCSRATHSSNWGDLAEDNYTSHLWIALINLNRTTHFLLLFLLLWRHHRIFLDEQYVFFLSEVSQSYSRFISRKAWPWIVSWKRCMSGIFQTLFLC